MTGLTFLSPTVSCQTQIYIYKFMYVYIPTHLAIFVVTISVFTNALSLKKKGEVLEHFGELHSFLGSLPSISVIKLLCDYLLLICFHINLNLRPARRT